MWETKPAAHERLFFSCGIKIINLRSYDTCKFSMFIVVSLEICILFVLGLVQYVIFYFVLFLFTFSNRSLITALPNQNGMYIYYHTIYEFKNAGRSHFYVIFYKSTFAIRKYFYENLSNVTYDYTLLYILKNKNLYW